MGLSAEYIVDVAEALRQAQYDGAIWSLNCEQLNVNLMRLTSASGIPEHVNADLDVLLAIYEGSGELEVDGTRYRLGPGTALVVPRGTRRAITCQNGPLVYLTVHRQRGGLMPQ